MRYDFVDSASHAFENSNGFKWGEFIDLVAELSTAIDHNAPLIRIRTITDTILAATGNLEVASDRVRVSHASLPSTGELTTHIIRERPIQTTLSSSLNLVAPLKVNKWLQSDLTSNLPIQISRITRLTASAAELPSILVTSGHLHFVVDFASELNASHSLIAQTLQRLNDSTAELVSTVLDESSFGRARGLVSTLSSAIIQTSQTVKRVRISHADLAAILSLDVGLYVPGYVPFSAELFNQADAAQIKFDRVRSLHSNLVTDIDLTSISRIVSVANFMASLQASVAGIADPLTRKRVFDAELEGYHYIIGNMQIIFTDPNAGILLYKRDGSQRIYLYDRTGQTLVSLN